MTAIVFNILRILSSWNRGSLCTFNVRHQDIQDFLVIPIIADQMGI